MKPANILVVVLSLVAVGLVVWWDWQVFAAIGMEMPLAGWVALVLGVVVTVALGIGLMFLVFYSSRRGYDEVPERDDLPSGQPEE
jgi:hypothetical protein